MRNKEVVIRKLETIENLIVRLRQIINSQEPRNVYLDGLNKLDETVEEVKDFIENEIAE